MDTIIFGTPQPPTSTITPYRSLTRITPPTVEPVTLAEAKAQCRIDTEDSDTYLMGLIAVARQYVEDVCDITLMTSVWEAKYDLFPIWAINLPRPPMAPGTVTVTYRNGDGTYGTITSTNGDFRVDTDVIPGRIYPNWSKAWPPTRGDENSVTVRYTAGYGSSATDAPPIARHLIMMLVAHWFDMRAVVTSTNVNEVPVTFHTLLNASGLGVYR